MTQMRWIITSPHALCLPLEFSLLLWKFFFVRYRVAKSPKNFRLNQISLIYHAAWREGSSILCRTLKCYTLSTESDRRLPLFTTVIKHFLYITMTLWCFGVSCPSQDGDSLMQQMGQQMSSHLHFCIFSWIQMGNPFLSELQIFTVHFVIAVYLEHAIFNPLQPAKCKYANCSENESES